MSNTVSRKMLVRDFLIANIAGGFGGLLMFVGILLQMGGTLPKTECAFLNATHMYCPGCGGSRALLALLKMDILRSIHYNPAVILGAVLILYYEITVIMTIVSKKGKVYYCKTPIPVYVYIGIVIVYAIVRDILLVGFGIDLI